MAKNVESSRNSTTSNYVPLDPAARESQMISLAEELAERQLREGTASSQVIVHYLKLGTQREKTEREILERQKDLISAKTENLKSAKRLEELYETAIKQMQRYGGMGDNDGDYDGSDIFGTE